MSKTKEKIDGSIKLCESELSVMILTELMHRWVEKKTYAELFDALQKKDKKLSYQEFLDALEELSDLGMVEIEKFEYMQWLKT